MTKRLLALLVALTLSAAGCGDDGGDAGGDGGGDGDEAPEEEHTAEEQALADAWASTLQDDDDGFGLGREDAQCMADALMVELGAAPFEDAGVTPDDIDPDDDESNSPGEVLGDGVVSEAQAEAVLDAWQDDCIDLAEMMAASAAPEFDLDDEGEACVADAFADEEDLVRAALLPSFTQADDTPDEDTITELFAVVDECSGGGGSDAIMESIVSSLMEDGTFTEEQARCLGAAVVEELGMDRLMELGAGGSFEDAPPEAQQQVVSAMLEAARACDVPLSAFG